MNNVTQESMFGGAELADDIEPRARARRDDPGTSKEAAAKVSAFAGNHFDKITQAMKTLAKPAGAEQIAATLLRGGVKLDAYQIRKRLPEMQKRGQVRVAEADRGEHHGELVRETSSGRHERLWELTGG